MFDLPRLGGDDRSAPGRVPRLREARRRPRGPRRTLPGTPWRGIVRDVPPGARLSCHRGFAWRRHRRGHVRPYGRLGRIELRSFEWRLRRVVPRSGRREASRDLDRARDGRWMRRLPSFTSSRSLRSLQRRLHRLPRRGQRHRHRAERRTASPERQGRPRRRERQVRRLPRDRRQSLASHGSASRPRDADPDGPPRVFELPRGACGDPRPGPSRRDGARRLLGARDGERRRSDFQRRPVRERGLPRSEPRGPGGSSALESVERTREVRRLPWRSAGAAHPLGVLAIDPIATVARWPSIRTEGRTLRAAGETLHIDGVIESAR